MLIIGLTGGVASGKSTVSQALREEGAYVIDADQIARELVEPQTPVWHKLIEIFGDEILQKDGSIHRKKLAALVFSHREKRGLLNQLLHPRIKEEIERRLREIGQRDPEALVVVDAALLVETGQYRAMDWLIVVRSSEAQQIERLVQRDGISREEARQVISAQMPLEEKVKVADTVISNDGAIEQTRRMAKEVFRELKRETLEKKRSNPKTRQASAPSRRGGKKRGL